MNRIKKKIVPVPILTVPAGDFERLKYAIYYGADAVYLGGKDYSLRTRAENFELDEIKEAVLYTHDKGKKIYIAVNIFAQNKDFERLPFYLKSLNEFQVDAVIVSDPGILHFIKKEVPDLNVHLSTQANNTNYMSALFWQEYGIKRIVLARELNINEIKEIVDRCPGMKFEVFVHGAVCISYSGRCFLSAYLIGRDANKGDCAHPCRWNYALIEEKERPGQYFHLEENDKGSMIFNSKDLCLLKNIPELIDAGVHSFKIEGRVKTLYYVASVARLYRMAIDKYMKSPTDYKYDERWDQELAKVNNRGYTEGFFHDQPTSDDYKYKQGTAPLKGRSPSLQFFLGQILNKKSGNIISVKLKNTVRIDDTIEIMMPDLDKDKSVVVKRIIKDGIPCAQANASEEVDIEIDPGIDILDGALLRKKSGAV